MSAVMEAREPSAKYLSTLQPPLVQHFELMATAPGGVVKLRELILTLAVKGKLVPQDPSDEPASELLTKIRAEKDRLIAEGRIKRDKPLEDISDQETSFALPHGWEWARLGEIGLVGSSSRVHQSDWKGSGVPFYRAREIVKLSRDGHVANELFISEELFASLTVSGWVPEENDIMITGVGTIGIPYIVRPSDRFYFKDASVLIFKNYGRVNAQWLTLLMQSPLWIQSIHEYSMGTTVDTLTIARANIALLPLPPVKEQSRIVARVEELMRLCDALETKGQLEAVQHGQLVQTLLGALTASTSPEELADNWQRLATHFDLLLDRPEAIDALEQTILQLAVRGLLVPQDPNDEPAENFVRRVNKEREIRRRQDSREVLASTEAAQLPKGWCVTNIGCLSESLDYIRKPIKKSDREATVGTVPYFGANGQVGWIDAYLFDEDLVLVVEDETFIGRTKPFSYIVRGKSWVNNHAHVLRPLGGMTVEYLNLCLERYDFIPLTSGTTNRRKLTKAGLLDAVLFVAPIREQSRIVARVESLRRLCADLRQRLAARQTTQAHLAEALIAEVA